MTIGSENSENRGRVYGIRFCVIICTRVFVTEFRGTLEFFSIGWFAIMDKRIGYMWAGWKVMMKAGTFDCLNL